MEQPLDAPDCVKAVERLFGDVKALRELTSLNPPPLRLVRAMSLFLVICGFGDASGIGFGSAIEINGQIHWRVGQWVQSLSAKSYNFRELKNLMIALEKLADNDGLD